MFSRGTFFFLYLIRRIDSYLQPDRRSERIIPLQGIALTVCETRAEGDNGVSSSRTTLPVIVPNTLCIRVALCECMLVSMCVCSRASVPRRQVSPRAYRTPLSRTTQRDKGNVRAIRSRAHELDSPQFRDYRGERRGDVTRAHSRALAHRKLCRPSVHGNRLWRNVMCARAAQSPLAS